MGVVLATLLLSSTPTDAPKYTVVNNCPTVYVVTNKVPAKTKTTTTTKTTVTYRAAIGHVHVCNRCGDAWDHTKNPTHTCQECGSQQFVIDTTRTVIPIKSATSSMSSETTTYSPQYTIVGTPGCVNGNCPAPATYQRRGLFR